MPILLVTRPKAAAISFADAFAGTCIAPFTAIVSPLQEIVAVAPEIDLSSFETFVFTSREAVNRAQDLGVGAGSVAYCVGDSTSTAAQNAGFRAVSASGDAESLIALVARHMPAGRLIHLRGEHGRGDVAARLTALGVDCAEAVVYRQEARDLSVQALAALTSAEPIVAPLFSPRSAALFANAARHNAPLHIVAISRAVAEALGNLRVDSLTVAERPDLTAMLDATCRVMKAQN